MLSLHSKQLVKYLAADEVLRRVSENFGFVQCDGERGLRYAANRLLRTGSDLSHDEKDKAMILVANTVEMILGDDRRSDKHFLKCFVIPNGPIEIEYMYDSHQRQTEHLLDRLATVLEYEIRDD